MRKKIAFIATANFTIRAYLYAHIKKMKKHYDITIISSGESSYFDDILCVNVHHISVNIERNIFLVRDLKAFLKLAKIIKKEKFSCVHTIMPKSGLIGMMAAYYCRTKVRFHTCTGQPWVTRKQPLKWFLIQMDRIIGRLTTVIMADSKSQFEFLAEHKIMPRSKSLVLGSGSICGVDINKFKLNVTQRKEFRSSLNIKDDDIVFMYLGRLTIDKGLLDLAHAFMNVLKILPQAKLIYVGSDEGAIVKATLSIIGNRKKSFQYFPYTKKPETYFNIADVFCLPSYREGFGTVILEAAAFGIPSIGSNIYGIIDAIQDEKTGLLFPPKDIKKLTEKILHLGQDKDYRTQLGQNALKRTRDEFSQDAVTDNLLKLYREKV